ncbi:MAG TPA: glutaredoxin [Methanoculleus sp.]|mgnify:CR=1 FL=1|nr:glutaredoxin [Methanoculleus sp.]
MPEVRVYSTRGCQYCRMVKALLDRLGVAYEDIDVGADPAKAAEMIELSGQFAVPVTAVGGEIIVGYDAKRLNELFGSEQRGDLYDVIIIGGGPAGLTAGMYVARKNMRGILLTENIGGQATESWAIENYMGYRMVTGQELIAKFEEQVRELHLHIELDSVTSVVKEGTLFRVDTVSEQTFTGKSLILCSGVRPRWLGLENEEKFIGHGESVCSTCDGPLFRGKVVAIVGGGNYALTTAIEMSDIAKAVYLIVRSTIKADEVYLKPYREKDTITTYQNYVVSALHGDRFLEAITIRERDSGEEIELPVDGLFLSIGHEPNTGFLDGLVELNEAGEVVVDQNCHTSEPGVFAAGDITSINGKQVVIACGEGAKAALEAYAYVMKQE